MRYALVSDIHANLPALDAVLRDIATRNADAVYHLGDLVGYAPWPNEVVARIVAEKIPGVAGNYDSTVATDYEHCGCRDEDAQQEALSHLSYAWTREHVTAATKAVLAALPFRIDIRPLGGHVSGPSIILVHGNHALNTVYVGADRSDELLAKMGASLGARAGDVVAFGHTHVAWQRVVGGVVFMNGGSVGRPKDGDPRAGYLLVELGSDGGSGEVVRVEYDVEEAARAIADSGLPNEFGDFLRRGGAARAIG
jgi:predicted phosphodiesterase